MQKPAHEAGIPLDLYNAGVGTPAGETSQWMTLFRDFLLEIDKYPEHRIGLHEYMLTDPFMSNMGHLIGRDHFLTDAATLLKLRNRPRRAITECGWDKPGWRSRSV